MNPDKGIFSCYTACFLVSVCGYSGLTINKLFAHEL